MKRGDDGWWQADIKLPAPDSDYGFVPDREGPFPGLRSPWQPNGIHQISRLVDHSAFAWTDAGFNARPLADAVIYELHVGTFTAAKTFDSAIERLDYLVQLGVTHVELMPVNEFLRPSRVGVTTAWNCSRRTMLTADRKG